MKKILSLRDTIVVNALFRFPFVLAVQMPVNFNAGTGMKGKMIKPPGLPLPTFSFLYGYKRGRFAAVYSSTKRLLFKI